MSPAALSILTTDLHQPARPQHRARRLGRRPRPRRRLRRRPQRRPHPGTRLALDLLPQRARRPPRRHRRVRTRRPASAAAAGRAASTSPVPSLSPPGCCCSSTRFVQAPDVGWASAATLGGLAVGSRHPRRLRRQRTTRPQPARSLLDLPHQGPRRRQPDPADHLRRALLDVLLPQPLHAERARLLADPHRPRLPPAHRRLHDRGRARHTACCPASAPGR